MPEKPLYQGPIFVQKSPIHGYGVFAAADIAQGEIIEECYTLLVNDDDVFPNYYFRSGDYSGLPLGFGSIYNHSLTPNVEFQYHPKTELIVFTTLRAISRGEELCSSYGKHWFDARNITPRASSGWRRAYQLAKGQLLRAALTLAALWGLIQGIGYVGINRFISF